MVKIHSFPKPRPLTPTSGRGGKANRNTLRIMSNEWRLVSARYEGSDALTRAFGVGTKTFTFVNRDTGQRVKVYASDEEEAGEKLAEGDFIEVDDD